MSAILAIINLVIAASQAGINAVGLLNSAGAVIAKAQAENRDPTDAEWDALDAQIAALRAQLQAP